MKRLLSLASIVCMLVLSQFGDSSAAGPYDGKWAGAATSTGGRCKPASVTLTVAGEDVTGQAMFGLDALSITGTVGEDGTLGATIGFRHLTGRFTRDQFEGAFKNSDCAWKVLLKRTA